MPLPVCDPWSANTIRFSDQQSACKGNSAGASAYELPEETFLALVLDSLQRLAAAGVEGFQPLSEYVACEGEKNAHDAYVRVLETTLPFQTDATQQKQQILWQLANALCANSA